MRRLACSQSGARAIYPTPSTSALAPCLQLGISGRLAATSLLLRALPLRTAVARAQLDVFTPLCSCAHPRVRLSPPPSALFSRVARTAAANLPHTSRNDRTFFAAQTGERCMTRWLGT
jgi:hypothetical protein